MELRIDRLTKQYGAKIAVDRMDFTLKAGVYGLLGANGAGKTTLMRMICDILRPTSGEVLYDGRPISEQGDAYRMVLGYLPQQFGYYPEFTANKFMMYMAALKGLGKSAAAAKTLELLELVGLSEVKNKKIKTFSTGMKMKLSIAAALSHGAELLILDEATSGLDPVVRDEVLDLLYDFMQDESHAVLLSSHITSDLDKIADNITFIHHGRVLLSEGRDELIDRHGVLRCTEEQLNALDPDAVRAVRKGTFGCEALVKRDGIPENWPVEPVSVEQIMMFLTKGEEVR